MEKPQFTFAVRASGLTGPLGNTILAVNVVLERDRHELVFLRGSFGNTRETVRWQPSVVPLGAYEVKYVLALANAEMVSSLTHAFGVQLELDDIDP